MKNFRKLNDTVLVALYLWLLLALTIATGTVMVFYPITLIIIPMEAVWFYYETKHAYHTEDDGDICKNVQ